MILVLSDREEFGFNEETLPPLIALMDSASPDYLDALFLGVTGYFLASSKSLNRVEKAIQDAEKLRDSDDRFSELAIGLGMGDLIADFDWLGRVKKSGIHPLGGAANDAARNARVQDGYLAALKNLKNEGANQRV